MSHAAPQRPRDPEGDKKRALMLAKRAAERSGVAEESRNNAIRFASSEGASLREIADATGLGHMTVKRIVDKEKASN